MRRHNRRTAIDVALHDIYRIGNTPIFSEDEEGVTYAYESDDWDSVVTNRIAELREYSDRLNKTSAVYQRANRIITGDSELEVTIVSEEEDTDDPITSPARNNGKEIQFNSNLIENLDTTTITSLSGLNYHEVAHVLFTPRAGSNLGKYVHDNRLVRAFNILEEGRVETLLTNKYPATRLFLEATISDYVLKHDPSDWADSFLVTTGRKHLALELRQMICDKFIAKHGVDMAERLHRIIHEYRTLAFPRDFDRAKELCRELSVYVGLDEPKKGNGGGQGRNNGSDSSEGQASNNKLVNSPCDMDRPLLHKGRVTGGKEQEELQNKESNNPIKKENLSNDSGNLSDHNASENGAGDYEGEERDFTSDDKVMADKLNRRLKEIENNERVKREVKDTRDSIIGSDEVRTSIPKAKAEMFAPSPTAIVYARRFGQELERIARDNDPHWDRFLPSGKLNISRTMNPDVNAIGQMFDVWDTGNDNTEIEACILIDNSSSMGGMMRPVCETAWIIKRGIESIEGKVSVFSFCHESKILYDGNERAKPRDYRYIHSTGSTNPIQGLLETQRIFDNTDKPNRILFIVTDGEWGNEELCDKVIAQMQNESNVLVCVVYIGYYDGVHEVMLQAKNGDEGAIKQMQRIRHGAQLFHAVGDTRDVLGVATNIVKETMTRKQVA